jgi:hypothetical protein
VSSAKETVTSGTDASFRKVTRLFVVRMTVDLSSTGRSDGASMEVSCIYMLFHFSISFWYQRGSRRHRCILFHSSLSSFHYMSLLSRNAHSFHHLAYMTLWSTGSTRTLYVVQEEHSLDHPETNVKARHRRPSRQCRSGDRTS